MLLTKLRYQLLIGPVQARIGLRAMLFTTSTFICIALTVDHSGTTFHGLTRNQASDQPYITSLMSVLIGCDEFTVAR